MKSISGFLYRNSIKPILFLFPADTVHTFFLSAGRWFGKSTFFRQVIRSLWRYDNKKLTQEVSGMVFENPIGLSAGFDYNADLQTIMPDVGFGFHTIGTLTYEAYSGNPKPMLGRLPKSQSLLVNKGFKNNGIETVLPTLRPRTSRASRGVSIGATNKAYDTFDAMVEDIVKGFTVAQQYDTFDYFELNISCPNLSNIQNLPLQIASPLGFLKVLEALSSLTITRPVWVKLPLERTHEEYKALIDTAIPFPFITGIIIANLAKNRANPRFDKDEIAHAGKGNFSGKPVEEGANDLIRFAYRNYKDRFVIVGVGGVFSAEDAYKKIRSGATLVQLITGMIYQGPQLIGEINQGLVRLLARDNCDHITKAIGADVAVE